MFARVTLHASDVEASDRFFATVLGPLDRPDRGELAVVGADAGGATSGLHLGLGAPSRAHVDAFWRAGVDAGYRSDGAPGPRPYTPDYYGAFLLDPDGNSVELTHHTGMRVDGLVDHLWIRVTDAPAAMAFYAGLADAAGLRQAADEPGYARFAGHTGSISVVTGPPTRNAHVAIAVADPGGARTVRDPDGTRIDLVPA